MGLARNSIAMFLRGLAVSFCVSYANLCSAWNGAELFDQLNTDSINVSAHAYIYGVIDSTYTTDLNPGSGTSLCYFLPEPFDIEKFALVVKLYLLANPDKLNMHAPQLIVMAMHDRYPNPGQCRYELRQSNR